MSASWLGLLLAVLLLDHHQAPLVLRTPSCGPHRKRRSVVENALWNESDDPRSQVKSGLSVKKLMQLLGDNRCSCTLELLKHLSTDVPERG